MPGTSCQGPRGVWHTARSAAATGGVWGQARLILRRPCPSRDVDPADVHQVGPEAVPGPRPRDARDGSRASPRPSERGSREPRAIARRTGHRVGENTPAATSSGLVQPRLAAADRAPGPRSSSLLAPCTAALLHRKRRQKVELREDIEVPRDDVIPREHEKDCSA
jgi:hypothetical protein